MTYRDAVLQACEAWHASRGADSSMWLDMAHDRIEVRSLAQGRPGVAFTAQPLRGRPAFQSYFDEMTEAFQMDYYRVHRSVAEGDRVVVMGEMSWTFKATGRNFVSPIVTHVLFEDGKIIEFEDFYDTAAVLAATA